MFTYLFIAVLSATSAQLRTDPVEKSAIKTLVKRINASPKKFKHQNGGFSLTVDVGPRRYQIYHSKYIFQIRCYDKWQIQDVKLDGVIDFGILKTTEPDNKSFDRQANRGLKNARFWQNEYHLAVDAILEATAPARPTEGRPSERQGKSKDIQVAQQKPRRDKY